MIERSTVRRRKEAEPSFTASMLSSSLSGFEAAPASASPVLGHAFSQISPVRPQAKLTVNQPGDTYEQEADAVAHQVMRMGEEPDAVREGNGQDAAEEKIQRTSWSRPVTALAQRAEDGEAQNADVSGIVQQGLSGGGQPLDNQTRAFMEPRFGHDFSNVRIHTDAPAAQSANQVAARAYTVGNDIAFRSGDYNPGSSDGRRLLAHELTHVVQQGAAPEAVQRKVAVSDAPSQVIQRDDPPAGTTTAPPAAMTADPSAVPQNAATQAPGAVAPQPDPNEIWRQIETRATPELLIKLQEIGRAAGEQTKGQINDLFSPYEDSLESDQTFLAVMSIPLGGGGNMPQGGGPVSAEAAGGLSGAAAAAAQLGMTKIMDFKSVGQVKAQANGSIGDSVAASLTSDSPLYMSFESEALIELRTEFDTSWAAMTSEAKKLDPATITAFYVSWFQMAARNEYGTSSPRGAAALAVIKSQVAGDLAPVKEKLDDLKDSQQWKRTGAGALGGAVGGALVGGAIGGPLGALIGGAIGGIGGAIVGWLW